MYPIDTGPSGESFVSHLNRIQFLVQNHTIFDPWAYLLYEKYVFRIEKLRFSSLDMHRRPPVILNKIEVHLNDDPSIFLKNNFYELKVHLENTRAVFQFRKIV